MRVAIASLLPLAACGPVALPANEQSNAFVLPGAGGDVSAAQRKVRERLGDPEGLAFIEARRSASEGVDIVCGAYELGGQRQRYVVVDGTDAFVEPQMRPGGMDEAFAEFCGEGRAE